MKMLIAGEQVDSESGQTTEVRNPATGELVDSVPKGTVKDIRRAIDAAQGALKKWSHMAPSKRGAVLLAAGPYHSSTGKRTRHAADQGTRQTDA